MLVRADPQGIVPKPSKKVDIGKVNQLDIVNDALRRHALAGVVAAISLTSLELMVLLDMINRGSFGSSVAPWNIFPH